MTTNALSKLLKKKKLTGEEVGKIILIDMVNDHLGKPTLSKVEKDAYVDALVDNKDIRTYNDYLSLYRFLGSMILDYESTSRAYAVCALEVIRQISEIKTAENAYFIASLQPRILTKKDYDVALSEARDIVKTFKWGVVDILQKELEEHAKLFTESKETPYKYYFDEAKKQSAKGLPAEERRLFVYSEDHKKDLSKFDLLVDFFDVYTERETEIKGIELEFKKDFPALTQAILDKYSKFEGLEHLANLSDTDFINDELVDFETAYRLDILDARSLYDTPILEHKGYTLDSGIAIIDETTWQLKTQDLNIKNGTYYYRLGGLIERHLAENVLASSEIKSSIHRAKKQLMLNAKYLQSFEYILEKMAEITGVKEILVYKKEDGSEALNAIKGMVNDLLIFRRGLMLNEGKQDELSSELKALLNPNFTIEELKPDAEDIQHLEKIIEEAQSDGKAVMAIANYLLGVSL